jgi:hypothetical protein
MKTAAAAIAGALMGLGCSFLLQHFVGEHPVPRAQESVRAPVVGEIHDDHAKALMEASTRMAEDLSRRVEQLERASALFSPTRPASPPPEEDPEEVKLRYRDEHASKVAAMASERVDRPWARETERTIDASLRQQLSGKGDFNVLHVECRSRSCLAEVEFGNYSEAERNLQTLLLPPPSNTGCASDVWMDRPEDPTAKLRTTVLYECARD